MKDKLINIREKLKYISTCIKIQYIRAEIAEIIALIDNIISELS